MKNKKFWAWKNQADGENASERVLELYGTIAEESWFDDDVTPKMFRDELNAGTGDITILYENLAQIFANEKAPRGARFIQRSMVNTNGSLAEHGASPLRIVTTMFDSSMSALWNTICGWTKPGMSLSGDSRRFAAA